MGVPITGTITTTSPTDTYATIDPLTGIDGLRSVADATTRNAIPTLRRRLGMFVVLQSDLSVWQLNTNTNTGTNADWTQFTSGGSASRTFSWSLGFNSNVVVATDQANWVICNRAGTLTRWDIVAKTAPVGASLVLDILKSSNGGSTWVSLWASNPANRPILATTVGQAHGVGFDTNAFAAGDLLRLDVVQVGSTTAGQGVSLTLLSTLS